MTGLVDAVKQATQGGKPNLSLVPKGQPGQPAEEQGGQAFEMLAQIEKNVEQQLPDSLRKAYLGIVMAGRQLMFSEQTHDKMVKYMATIKGPEDVPAKVAHGVVKTITIVANEVSQKNPKAFSIPAAGSASITLMTHALKYVDGQLNIPVTMPMIDQTAKLTGQGMLAAFGVDENMTKQAVQAAAQQGGQGQPVGKPPLKAVPPSEPTESTEPTEGDDEEEA